MGACAAGFAWLSYNLFHLSMENIRFLRMAGWLAVMEGGLYQLAGIVINGLAALACYVGFKTCEVELVHRWRSYRFDK
jgi:hypothetical protein